MRRSLETYLQENGGVSPDQLRDARRTQSFFGGSLFFNLIRLNVLHERQAEEMVSEWMGYPYATLRDIKHAPSHAIDILEPAVAGRRRLIPFRWEEGEMFIATSRPDNETFVRDLERRLGAKVILHAVLEERLEGFLEKHYGIPAPKRDAVAPVDVEDQHSVDRPFAAPADPNRPFAAPADPKGEPKDQGPQIGLDGLPLDSEEVAPELLPTASTGRSPVADAFDTSSPEEHQDRPVSMDSRPAPEPATPAYEPVPEPAAPVYEPVPEPAARVYEPVPEPAARAYEPVPEPASPAYKPVVEPGTPLVTESSGFTDTSPLMGTALPLEKLAKAMSREEIGQAAVELALTLGLKRAVLFGVQKERLVGWNAKGEGVDQASIRQLSIPLYTPSIFSALRVKPAPYIGIVPEQPANQELMSALGGERPRIAAAIPVVLKGRTLAVLYVDDGPKGSRMADLPALTRLTSKLSVAFEIMLLRKKIQA